MKKSSRILILEERGANAAWLKNELHKSGVQFEIQSAATESDFRGQVSAFAPDVIVADHWPPVCDGIAALSAARQESCLAPFILICAETEEETAMRAPQQGATDYVLRGRLERLGLAVRRALREREERYDHQLTVAALEEMEDRYRTLFDRSPDCLYVHDLQGRFLDANAAGLALLGYTREDIPSVTLNSLLSVDHLPRAMKCLEELVLGTQQRSMEFTLRHKNGGEVVVETQASLLLNQGKPFAILGIAHDTTERQRAELELRRLNRLYAVLSHVNQILIRARTPEELLQQVCAVAVEHGGFQAARICRMDSETRRVMPIVKAGGLDEFLRLARIYADNRPEGQGPTGSAIREGKTCVFNDFLTDPRSLPWREAAEVSGVKAAASFPVLFGGEVYGALTLYVGERKVFQEKEVALLSNVAEAIASGLERLEEEARRKRTEESLKQRDEAVRESEARYRRVVLETGQLVYDYDLATGMIQWEGATEEVLGYTRQEMQQFNGRLWEENVHPEDGERAQAQLEKAISRGERYRVEYRFRRADGNFIFVSEHGSFLLDEMGKAARMFGTISDITERKNAEERILEQARWLDLAHDAILALDLNDIVVYWNQSAERLYGWKAEEAMGRNVNHLFRRDPSKAAEIKGAVLQHDEWNGELTHLTKSGEEVLVETRLTLVRDRQGEPKSILAINTDITSRRKMEARVLRSQRMESIGTLASGIAHDLNNVLAPILMSCNLLSSCPLEDDQKSCLEIIEHSAQRGADLVRQVLSFCRGVEGRRMELQVKSLIHEVNDIIKRTFPKSIKVQIKLGKDLWTLVADPTQMHQVLLNLCLNARDAMPDGGTLSISAENAMLDSPDQNVSPEARHRPHLRIAVADTGAGMLPEIQEKIFDPFFTTKEPGKGTGLGLSTSLGIVRSHGGFISVFSQSGVGSVFTVCIPAVLDSHAASLKTEEEHLPRGNGELVLVVDDEASVRTITAIVLQTYGYKVITASNGAEAIELYGRHAKKVAVILMDMVMPVMDGPTTIHALCRWSQHLKIIAVSGLSSEMDMTKIPAEAVKAFLPKPYTTAKLLKTTHQVLADTVPRHAGPKDNENGNAELIQAAGINRL
jgi:PAS domain S-box-containing protein